MEDRMQQETARKFLNKSVWIGLALLMVVVGFIVYARVYMKPTPIPDIFKILQDQGYSANIGFSGVFGPGNVVQIAERGPNREERTLPTPVLFLWGADCFPGMTPRIDPFALPQTSGMSSASLNVGAEALAKLVPKLQVDSRAIVEYTLKIENLRVHTFAKGDLSGSFSDKCVHAYDRQISAGDKPEWFAIILDAVVAERLNFEMKWSADTSAKERAAATRDAEEALSQMLTTARPGKEAPEASVQLKSQDQEHTIIAAEGPVFIGYRARPMQRQWNE